MQLIIYYYIIIVGQMDTNVMIKIPHGIELTIVCNHIWVFVQLEKQ